DATVTGVQTCALPISLQVLEQAAALRDHPEQAALSVKVFGVHPKVIGEAVDPLGEQRDLDRGRPRVSLVLPVLPDRRRLVVHLRSEERRVGNEWELLW